MSYDEDDDLPRQTPVAIKVVAVVVAVGLALLMVNLFVVFVLGAGR